MPRTHLTLQHAHPSEAAELAALRVEAMRESLEQVGRFDPARARDRFILNFSAQDTRHICVGESRVGLVVVRPHEEKGGLLLDHLYVRPGAQSQGIGAAVLSIVFAEADQQGKSITVGALKDSRSNQFYIRHGFRLVETGEWDNYYVREAQSVV
jgi:predicted N-acetyltransferase YhbS